MLQYTLAPIQRLQSSLIQANTLPQRARLADQIILAAEGRELLQKQARFIREVSAYGPPSILRETYSKAKEETVSIKSACPTVMVPGFRKQPPPLNLQQTSKLRHQQLGRRLLG